jgi:hypothetical protein
MDLVRPLDRYPVIRTRDIDDLREAMARLYIKPSLELHDRAKTLDATYNNCQISRVGLSYATFGTAVRLEFPESKYHVQLFPIRGKGEVVISKLTAPLTADRGVTISSDMMHEPRYGADYEHLILRINSAALIKKLAAMTGATISAPLRMHPAPNFKRPAAQMLRRYFRLLVSELSSATAPLPAWAQSQIEQLLMVMFLFANEHNYSNLLEQEPKDVAPWQVRHAEEYIEANPDRPINLEDLSEVTGVSMLGLFRSFKRGRGYSPLEFARRVRRNKRGDH